MSLQNNENSELKKKVALLQLKKKIIDLENSLRQAELSSYELMDRLSQNVKTNKTITQKFHL